MMRFFFLMIAVCFCVLESVAQTEDCRMRDSLILVDLYNATGGENWTRNDNWLSDRPMNEWFGITTNSNGCVTHLELCQNCYEPFSDIVGNQLSGTLPSSIGDLSELEVLVIVKSGENYGGNLSGTIPVKLGNLINLARLWLYNNDLINSIPSELGNLSNLTRLALGGNDLSGTIPVELGNLSNLNRLSLGSNDLSGSIPVELGDLPNLTQLRLNNNDLSGCFPEELLTNCNISYDFTVNSQLPWQGDFERFCNREEQIGAACDDGNANTQNDIIGEDCICRGTEIVVNECRMRDSLELVRLYNAWNGDNWDYINFSDDEGTIEHYTFYNEIIDSIYVRVPNAGNEWSFDNPMDTWHGVETNQEGCVIGLFLIDINLTGNLIDINLPSLERFYCDENMLTGAIPNFTNLPSLKDFWCSYNNLTEGIPDFDGIPALEFFNCAGNQLTGIIPNFSNLTTLKHFNCRKNEFIEGSIPNFSNIPNMEYLNLSQNNLTGTIPDFDNLPNLLVFYCSGNSISSSIPDFSSIPTLKGFSCGGNEITGILPEFSNLPNLTLLLCGFNKLVGKVPDFTENCPDLGRLSVNENKYTFSSILPSLDANQLLVDSISEGLFQRGYRYYPQDSIYSDTLITVTAGQSLSIDLIVDERIESNTYQWYKDSIAYHLIEGSNDLIFENIQLNDAGIYNVEVTNPNLPDLTLYSRNITITVELECESVESTLTQSICEDESYLFDNQNLTEVGVYTATYQTINGCDSIITLILEDVSMPISAEDDTYLLRVRNPSVRVEPLINDYAPENVQFRLLEDITIGKLEWEDESKGIFKLQLDEPTIIEVAYELCDRDCPTVCDTASIYIQYFDKDVLEQTGFTPNNDGKNDFFVIPELEDLTRYPKASLTVFNRWGDLVFQAQPYYNNWDGRHIKTGKPLPSASYYYIIRLDLGQGEIRYGQITIIR